jgi:hypothetical protein
MIGYLDGDGYIEWMQGSKGYHCSMHVHCHMSWKEWLVITFNRMTKILNVECTIHDRPCWNKVQKKYYIDVSINSKEFIRKLKQYILDLNIPYLERKWGKIDINDIGHYELMAHLKENKNVA